MLFKELKYVIAIEEYGSISKAADHLYISQPALSKYLRNLEDSLDFRIFENSGKGILLTEAGKRYIAAARSMMNIYNDVTREVNGSDEMLKGSLSVGTSFTRGPMFFPEVLPEFKNRFPNVNVSIYEENSYNLEEKLLNGEIDFLFSKGPIRYSSSFHIEHLFHEEFLLLLNASPDGILQKYPQITDTTLKIDPALFRKELFVLLKTGHHSRFMADMVMEKAGFFPENYLEVNNIHSVISLVSNMNAVAFSPKYFVTSECTGSLNIRSFSIDINNSQETNETFSLIYRQDFHMSKFAKGFVEIVKKHFSAPAVSPDC